MCQQHDAHHHIRVYFLFGRFGTSVVCVCGTNLINNSIDLIQINIPLGEKKEVQIIETPDSKRYEIFFPFFF